MLWRNVMAALGVGIFLAGCGPTIQHEVKPIHVTVDVNVNIKIDQELEDLFAFEDTMSSGNGKAKEMGDAVRK